MGVAAACGVLFLLLPPGSYALVRLLVWLRRPTFGITTATLGIGPATRRTRKKHSILDVTGYSCLDDYLRDLGRSARQTLVKNGPGTLRAKGLTMRTSPAGSIGLEHLRVILAHERRVYWLPRAVLAAWMRFLVSCLCIGDVDEFRDSSGRLVAYSQTVMKGNCLRGMWFYQRGRLGIWFFCLRAAVSRAVSLPHVIWVDLGPSQGAIAEAKGRFLFEDTATWADRCDYSGPYYRFRPHCPLDEPITVVVV